MWKRIAIVGGTAAVILGAGTAALATTGNSSATPAPSASGATAKAAHHHARKGSDQLTHALHATWVTGGAEKSVTHDAIRGLVTAVSPTAISVKAADGVSETYTVGSATKVHTRAEGKSAGTTGAIGSVKVGDTVEVLGTGTSPLTATHVVDRGVKGQHAKKSVTPTPSAPSSAS